MHCETTGSRKRRKRTGKKEASRRLLCCSCRQEKPAAATHPRVEEKNGEPPQLARARGQNWSENGSRNEEALTANRRFYLFYFFLSSESSSHPRGSRSGSARYARSPFNSGKKKNYERDTKVAFPYFPRAKQLYMLTGEIGRRRTTISIRTVLGELLSHITKSAVYRAMHEENERLPRFG